MSMADDNHVAIAIVERSVSRRNGAEHAGERSARRTGAPDRAERSASPSMRAAGRRAPNARHRAAPHAASARGSPHAGWRARAGRRDRDAVRIRAPRRRRRSDDYAADPRHAPGRTRHATTDRRRQSRYADPSTIRATRSAQHPQPTAARSDASYADPQHAAMRAATARRTMTRSDLIRATDPHGVIAGRRQATTIAHGRLRQTARHAAPQPMTTMRAAPRRRRGSIVTVAGGARHSPWSAPPAPSAIAPMFGLRHGGSRRR